MKAIMACDPSGGIGYNNGLPWQRLDGDLARFRHLTTNNAVVMGRQTWASLPKQPLPNRKNLVFSKTKLVLPQGATLISNLDQLRTLDDSHWFIGGAILLEFVFPWITEFHLTRTRQKYICDTHMNLLYLEQEFTKVSESSNSDNIYEIWSRL